MKKAGYNQSMKKFVIFGLPVLLIAGGIWWFWAQSYGHDSSKVSESSFKTDVGAPATITLKVGDTATDGVVEIKLTELDTNRFGQPIALTYVNADVNHEAYGPGGAAFGTAVGGIIGLKEGFLDSAVSTGVIVVKVTDISFANNTATLVISAGQK